MWNCQNKKARSQNLKNTAEEENDQRSSQPHFIPLNILQDFPTRNMQEKKNKQQLFPHSAVNHKTVTAWMKLSVGLMSPWCLQTILCGPTLGFTCLVHHSESDVMSVSILGPVGEALTDSNFMLQNTKINHLCCLLS